MLANKERRYVGGAFIMLNEKMREQLWARVNAKAKPLKGVKVKPGTQWLKPGLVGRVRHLKGEQLLRHATPLRMTRAELCAYLLTLMERTLLRFIDGVG
jgi:hypothetical protein